MSVGNNKSLIPVRPGSIGRAMPGHVCAIVNDEGQPQPPGAIGNIAVRRPDPVMMLRYWNDPDATKNKYAGDWLLTGDMGVQDEDGYFWFRGRGDDIINSAGYRIGPSEIENALIKHPAVVMAGVIGIPDADRGEVIKAYLTLTEGEQCGPELAKSIQEHVRGEPRPA